MRRYIYKVSNSLLAGMGNASAMVGEYNFLKQVAHTVGESKVLHHTAIAIFIRDHRPDFGRDHYRSGILVMHIQLAPLDVTDNALRMQLLRVCA